jgi:uncharacterized protein YuzE
MVFEYHKETDMLYIKLADGVSVESEEVSPGVVVDYDEKDRAIGIEIEDASKYIEMSRLELKAMSIANLVINESIPVAG